MSADAIGYASVNGTEIYYETAGEGEPLMLLHAGIADSRLWDTQFKVFAQEFKVIRYDLRGFGKSVLPASIFTGYGDTFGLLDYFNVERAYLIGISNGGRVALDFALAYQGRVNKLILAAPSAGGHPPSNAIKQFWQEEGEALQRGDLEAATELNLRLWVDGPSHSPNEVDGDIRKKVYEMQMLAFQIDEPDDAVEEGLEPRAIGRLEEVKADTLILVGDLDLVEKITLAKKLEKEIPEAQLEIISGAAHMVNKEKPEAFNRLALAFLSR
ncbi:MAG: alpha/beta hydrolase [Chloroflexi bacterium]|nr:alpha/beta hydrolase [Chloroflexota bacterium]